MSIKSFSDRPTVSEKPKLLRGNYYRFQKKGPDGSDIVLTARYDGMERAADLHNTPLVQITQVDGTYQQWPADEGNFTAVQLTGEELFKARNELERIEKEGRYR